MYFEGFRAEEFVYQKLDKPKPPRLTESEALGQSMIEAGNDFGPGTSYGMLHGQFSFSTQLVNSNHERDIQVPHDDSNLSKFTFLCWRLIN